MHITGRSMSSFQLEAPTEGAFDLALDVTPYAHSMTLPQPKGSLAWQDFGARGWWIEQFPAEQDLPLRR